jgi:hypothetical protein
MMVEVVRALIVAAGMITLHAPDNHEIFINPAEITVLHQKLGEGKGTFTEKATCMINTTDGRFITVTESCLYVLRAVQGE